VLIGLYQSIVRVLAGSPLQLVDLASRVYLPSLSALVPLNDRFLWLDLGRPDPFYIIPVLVVFTTWAQQKLLTAPSADAQSASMNQSMQIMMPLMLGFFALQYSSALAIYFVMSNVVGVAQYFIINRWFRHRWEKDSQAKRKSSRKPRPAKGEAESKTEETRQEKKQVEKTQP